MKKYFVTSDLHSFFHPFMDALTKAGFNYNDPDHILVVCGDVFDRGEETILLYEWIKSLPKKRRILIRGNHEYLLKDLLRKKFPDDYDYSNGTVKTCCAFAEFNYDKFKGSYYENNYETNWDKIRKDKNLKKIVNWIFNSKEWVNYYELDKYIFVHSFIPLHNTGQSLFYTYRIDKVSYNPNWRENATLDEWIDATWACPWQLFKEGLFKEPNKTLVVGHWHTSEFYKWIDEDFGIGIEKNPIYNRHGLVGLDACTALTHRVNIFVVEEEEKV